MYEAVQKPKKSQAFARLKGARGVSRGSILQGIQGGFLID